jgi:hypothetical protein
MASHSMNFSLNDLMYDRLLAEQKRREKTAISADMFAKELLCELLNPVGNQDKQKGVK